MLFIRDQIKPRKSGGNLSVAGDGNRAGNDDVLDVDSLQERDAGTIFNELNESMPPDTLEVDSVAEIPQAISQPTSQPHNRTLKRSALQ